MRHAHWRHWLEWTLGTILVMLWAGGTGVGAAAEGRLWSAEEAQRHGLVRAWFGQVMMDATRSRVQHMLLHEGTFFVQTDRAMLHAFDAETGRTQWAVPVGSPNRPSLAPAANAQFVAVVNGSTLFVLNRIDGKTLWKTTLEGFPGAGPSLGNGRVYVPMLQGLIYCYTLETAKDPREALGELRSKPQKQEESAEERSARMAGFRLSQEKIRPVVCQSLGHTMVPVRICFQEGVQEFVVWPSHLGYFFIGVLEAEEPRFTIRHRLQTRSRITAPPAYLPPDPKKRAEGGTLFVANYDGYVWALSEKTGVVLWKFPTGRIIEQSPVLIDEELYVTTLQGGMYCLDALSGKEKGFVPDVVQFVAASKQRIYTVDGLSRVHVLDRAKGTPLDTFSVLGHLLLTNTENDRLYLATPSGLVQCLHEIELAQPVEHGSARKPKQTGPAIIQQEASPQKKEEKAAPKPKPKPPPAEKAKAPAEEEEEEKPPAEEKPKEKEEGNLFNF